MAMSTEQAINETFGGDAKLRKRIFDAINETPQHAPLFGDIAKYFISSQQNLVHSDTAGAAEEQPSKKRKLDDGLSPSLNGSQSEQPRTVILEARDISFSIPQRKKLHLSLVQYGSDFNAPTTTFAICARNPANSQVEFEHPLKAFAYVVRVSVPEKAQKQYNFCLLPSQGQEKSDAAGATEGIIWTVNHGPLKSCQIFSDQLKEIVGTEDILEHALEAVLQRSGNKLVYPTEQEFASALVESHRKNDKAYHVKAFRGSKDGFLFFLENGIFFGFKKPLAFFPLHEIESVSYTAVLQRTFNLVIGVRGANDVETQEIEFSMIDQADFAGIDGYIKKHQLQDASMAEARRAKQFKVNGAKGEATEGADDGQTELQKAEQEMVDEEDEMEEDYDPENDDDSDGSGSSDDDEDYEYAPASKGRDLVKDELGSEAEDVEVTDEEDGGDEEDVEDVVEEEEEEEEQPKKQIAPQVATRPKPPPAPAPQYGGPDFDDEDQL